MKIIKFFPIAIIILIFIVACSSQPSDKDIESFLSNKFDCTTIQGKILSAPTLGRTSNYYISFLDKNKNSCYFISDTNLKKYIFFNYDSPIQTEKNTLNSTYKDLIDRELNPDNPNSEYKIKSELTDIRIVNGKSTEYTFFNGEIGVMQIAREFVYKNKELGKKLGPSKVNVVVLFAPDTKSTYEFDLGNKPLIGKGEK